MRILILQFSLFMISCNAFSQVITASGSWTPSVSTITEAGNDYASATISSAVNQTLISVSTSSILLGTVAHHYYVHVKRTDNGPNWNTAGLELWVKRTDTGSGGGGYLLFVSTILDGTSFLRITTSNQAFFQGYNYGTTARTGIPIQYEIRGISVKVPVATYSTQITYTLAED